MADKRKGGAGKQKRTVVRRRTVRGSAGRIAVRRDTAAYRTAAMDEHSIQVRDQIQAALAEAQRLREDIEQRIELRLKEEDQGTPGQVISRLTAEARLHTVKPLGLEARGRSEDTGRTKSSK
ncbi:hypothetical protein [Archangium lansingense]|uniref:Uncharacterized protein n=1 Tax=Archangium lansingense TaxID=2995310 RepID=A0ABT3ZVK7_9BACT|nr:hypothetical protein [Archangium lansinium]MCY1073099.1 hypothetical protein [Archangium lansinium]